MRAAIPAALVYVAIVFAAGLGLGALRTLLIAPRIGDLAAVAVELPVMLAISWFGAGLCITRFHVGSRLSHRITMGLAAFALLMGVEIALGVFGFGRSLESVVDGMTTPAGLLGLAGQVLFGLTPLLVRRRNL